MCKVSYFLHEVHNFLLYCSTIIIATPEIHLPSIALLNIPLGKHMPKNLETRAKFLAIRPIALSTEDE